MHFSPTIANTQYRDVDKSRQIIGHYRRGWHYEIGEFIGTINKRDVAPMLMD